jgi:glycosyl transferase family 25
VKLFVISLERFPERAAFMRAGLERLGLTYEMFPAIDGSRGQHHEISRYDEKECLRRFGAPLLPAEIACFASHFLLWERCVRLREPITVLEDDVALSPGFAETLAFSTGLIARHRFIRLAGYYERPFRPVETIDPRRRLVRFLQGPRGTQCYSIAPDGAAALLAFSQWWIEPVDLYIDRFWHHGVQSKAILPFEAWEVDRQALPQGISDRTHKRSGFAKLRREWNRLADTAARSAYNLMHS